MVQLITGVETSKGGRKYATNSNGIAMFGQTQAISDQLKVGAWVNTVERLQTMTRNEAGELVPIPAEQQQTNIIITAVFSDKMAALKSKTEPALFDREAELYLNAETAKLAAAYKVDSKSLEAAL